MIELTPAALSEIKRMQQSRNQPQSAFRLGVAQGGCAGYHYTFALCDRKTDNDQQTKIDDLSILIDIASQPYLNNLRLDYAEDLMGGGFRFQNPTVSSPCNCGLSFAANPP
jgi:iron-sulfur cluster assembly accessory protein